MDAPKIDWDKLKQDYKYGEVESVNGFLDGLGIKINGNVSRLTTGWRTERDEYQRQLEQTTQSKTVELVSDSEAQVRARQAKIAKYIQTLGLKALSKETTTENIAKATRIVEAGLREEREALGLNNQRQIINNTINSMDVLMNMPIMKTRYGKALLQMNNQELMAVLQRLGELKAARTTY